MRIRIATSLFAAGILVAGACSAPAVKPKSKAPGTAGTSAGSASLALPSFVAGRDYHPAFDPANFTPDVTNQWFPLKPGTTLVYEGTREGKQARDLFSPTNETSVIAGVTCRVVRDELYLNGKLAEQTRDYYAQDRDGNVWYFGEDTAEIDASGKVTGTSGTWHAHEKGAQPGVYMQAHPEVGRLFRQEYYKGEAEDQFKALSTSAPIQVPYGSYESTLQTEETSSLEPDVVDNKYYVQGVGEVLETAVKGPTEKLSLVEVRTA